MELDSKQVAKLSFTQAKLSACLFNRYPMLAELGTVMSSICTIPLTRQPLAVTFEHMTGLYVTEELGV